MGTKKINEGSVGEGINLNRDISTIYTIILVMTSFKYSKAFFALSNPGMVKLLNAGKGDCQRRKICSKGIF